MDEAAVIFQVFLGASRSNLHTCYEAVQDIELTIVLTIFLERCGATARTC